jgi:hypothetical protein
MAHGLAELRHGIRGTLNALKLCVSAFEMPLETSEKLEFLSDIELAADRLAALMGEFDALAPADAPSPEVIAAAVRVGTSDR